MKTMEEMVHAFPDQLEQAILLAKSAKLSLGDREIQHILVCGMGGSGIGADFVSAFFKRELPVPFSVCKSYEVPAYVNQKSLVIFSSYSGNTEETLSAMADLEGKTPNIICISSGGKLIERAIDKNYQYVKLPEDWPSPRACLGYSLVTQMYILRRLGFISSDIERPLGNSIARLRSEQSEIQEKAKHLANFLYQKKVIIYATDRIEPVAVRLRQQINENAKRLCWHHVIPEMNHNELVGWTQPDSSLVVLFIRNADDHPRNQFRMELTKDIVSHFSGGCIDVFSKGNGIIEKSLYLVHLFDYTSVYLAELNGVDAVEVRVIDSFKAAMARS